MMKELRNLLTKEKRQACEDVIPGSARYLQLCLTRLNTGIGVREHVKNEIQKYEVGRGSMGGCGRGTVSK